MLLDWSIIVIGICLSYYNIYFFPLSCLIIGNRQHALAILGHDGAHQLVVPKNKFLNNLFTNLFVFYPFGISLKEYRDFHWDHHRNTNIDKDPEIPLKEVWPNKMVGPFTTKKVILHSLLDLIGFGVPPTKRDSFSSKPTPKPAPYYNLDRYKSNEVKSSSYERYKQSLPKSRFDSQRTEWGKARVPSNPYKSSKK